VKVELFLGQRSNEMWNSFDEKTSMTAILVEGLTRWMSEEMLDHARAAINHMLECEAA